MEKATISEIKNRLSAYLKKVRAGESILILDRNQPVARLERIEPSKHTVASLTRLAREGLVRPPKRALALEFLRAPPPPPKPRQSVLEALLEERREDR
jgi:prevent-host-death family protein